MDKLVGYVLRYRVLHIAYWVYAFVVELHTMRILRPGAAHALANPVDAVNNIAFRMLAVYLCIGVLLPPYYKRERPFRLALGALGVVAAAALLNALVQLLYVPWIMPGHVVVPSGVFLITVIAEFVNAGGVVLVFLTIYLIRFYYLKDRRNSRLERERILTELDFLKAQINPHFLFNALNSIYVLMKEDLALSERTLLQFSALLRYQLYECSGEWTTLEKEVTFLRNYIEVEKVRSGDGLRVRFVAPERIPHFQMTPFLLIPFVENAFKHVSHHRDAANTVEIGVFLEENTLRFHVSNTCDDALTATRTEPAGIGLQNVKRRLQLLYPERHKLYINRTGPFHAVTLNLHAHAH